jgi:knotted carbamoyltransferase YgeW
MTDLDALQNQLEAAEASDLASLYRRSMLLTSDWSRSQLDTLCWLAETFEAFDRAGVATTLFPDELHLAVFFDSSTRTKSSWAGAASRLGARPLVVDGATTQVSHGETAEETGAMLGMNAHALGVRHDLILDEGNQFMRGALAGIEQYLAELGSDRVVPLVNLQCDIDHPTQTVADLCWLREQFPHGLAGKTVAVSWAYSPSYAKPLSVPQGLITLMTRYGANVRLAHPGGYRLRSDTMEAATRFAGESGGSFEIVNTMDEAFRDADVVYPKSWGPYDLMLERNDANLRGDQSAMADIEFQSLERNAGHTDWICDELRMGLTADGEALYMHCLPADIGSEVSAGVMDKYRHAVAREANKKVYVMMALLAGAKEPQLGRRLHELLDGAASKS